MVRCTRVHGLPGSGVARGTIAADSKVLTDRQALEAAVGAMTAGTGVVGIGCGTDQSVVVAAGASCRCDLNQGAVVRGNRCVGGIPGIRMAGGTVAAKSWDAGLQIRNGRVAEVAISKMDDLNRSIRGRPRIVTGHA